MILLVSVAVLVGMVGTALAINMIPLDPQRVTMWNAPTKRSHFTVEGYDVNVRGADRVHVDVTLRNTDANPQQANVTVQVLDGNGTVVAEASESTGTVGANNTWSHTFRFREDGLAERYERTLLIVNSG